MVSDENLFAPSATEDSTASRGASAVAGSITEDSDHDNSRDVHNENYNDDNTDNRGENCEDEDEDEIEVIVDPNAYIVSDAYVVIDEDETPGPQYMERNDKENDNNERDGFMRLLSCCNVENAGGVGSKEKQERERELTATMRVVTIGDTSDET